MLANKNVPSHCAAVLRVKDMICSICIMDGACGQAGGWLAVGEAVKDGGHVTEKVPPAAQDHCASHYVINMALKICEGGR